MKLSVIIPTYNVGKNALKRAILSVIDQDYLAKEIIIMDGKSTDDTMEAVYELESRIDFWESKEDGGTHDAITGGLKHATGELIGILGGTDWYEEGSFAAIAESYAKGHGDVFYGDAMIGSEEGSFSNYSTKGINLDRLFYEGGISTIGTFARSDCWNEAWSINDFHIADDAFFWAMLRCMGKEFVYIDCGFPLAYFSYGGISTTCEYPAWSDVRNAYRKVLSYDRVLENKYAFRVEKEYAVKIATLYPLAVPESELKSTLQSILRPSARCVLWGSGKIASRAMELLNYMGCLPEYIIDSSSENQGRYLDKIKICGPDILYNEENLTILVTSTAYESEILETIGTMNLHESINVISFPQAMVDLNNILGDAVLDKAYKMGLLNSDKSEATDRRIIQKYKE